MQMMIFLQKMYARDPRLNVTKLHVHLWEDNKSATTSPAVLKTTGQNSPYRKNGIYKKEMKKENFDFIFKFDANASLIDRHKKTGYPNLTSGRYPSFMLPSQGSKHTPSWAPVEFIANAECTIF